MVFGQEGASTFCIIKCTGRGPVVSIEPDEVNFGDVKLLTTVTNEVQIVSDSPIAAEFRAFFVSN